MGFMPSEHSHLHVTGIWEALLKSGLQTESQIYSVTPNTFYLLSFVYQFWLFLEKAGLGMIIYAVITSTMCGSAFKKGPEWPNSKRWLLPVKPKMAWDLLDKKDHLKHIGDHQLNILSKALCYWR